MRLLPWLLWVLVVVLLVLPALRRAFPARRREPAGPREELVKDPVCHTYVVRSRAVARSRDGQPVYFCSPRCASRWE